MRVPSLVAALGDGEPSSRKYRPSRFMLKVQLLSARVPLRTLTEHGLNFEGGASQPGKAKA